MEEDRQTGRVGEGKLDDECMFWTEPRREKGGGKGPIIKGKDGK